MVPEITTPALLLAANITNSKEEIVSSEFQVPSHKQPVEADKPEEERYEWKISWRNVLAFIYLHGATLYCTFLLLTGHVMLSTFIWNIVLGILGAFGVTAGAHRLWAHKAYKAKWQLRLILAFLQTIAFQNHLYEWVRDHRVHHKFTDTNADPHNSKRGFFFSHIGWLMVKKHPDVKIKGKTVDMSDLEQDPIVMWQKRTYLLLVPLFCFIMPVFVPCYFWNEEFWNAWYTSLFRYTLMLNVTWCVNSAAHIWGIKPYDENISSVENSAVGVLALGEGWHNYHHVFPWDYKAAELGNYNVNLSTGFIDMFAKIGWAYDLKTVSKELIRKRAERTGDGTLKSSTSSEHHMNSVWGWGDKDMSSEDKSSVTVYYPENKEL